MLCGGQPRQCPCCRRKCARPRLALFGGPRSQRPASCCSLQGSDSREKYLNRGGGIERGAEVCCGAEKAVARRGDARWAVQSDISFQATGSQWSGLVGGAGEDVSILLAARARRRTGTARALGPGKEGTRNTRRRTPVKCAFVARRGRAGAGRQASRLATESSAGGGWTAGGGAVGNCCRATSGREGQTGRKSAG